MTTTEDRFIVTLSKRNQKKTAPQLASETNNTRSDPISISTVHKKLQKAELFRCVVAVKPFLRSVNKKKEITVAKVS